MARLNPNLYFYPIDFLAEQRPNKHTHLPSVMFVQQTPFLNTSTSIHL
jgi:hypothetical protein